MTAGSRVIKSQCPQQGLGNHARSDGIRALFYAEFVLEHPQIHKV